MDSLDDLRLSRRSLLMTLGTGAAAAFLAGCENTPIAKNLPDPYLPSSGGALIPDTFVYAPPGTTPGPKITPVRPQVTPINGIIPRAAWAKLGPDLRRIDPMNGVAVLTFHHSGDPKPFTSVDYSETANHLEWVREYHRSRGFQDIGYHFAIDRSGRVWQLRSLKYQGEHVRNNNPHNIGVVVLGNFEMQSPTAAQKERIRTLGNLLRKQYRLDIKRVKTHREIVKTDCPGNTMQPYMVQIRKQGLI